MNTVLRASAQKPLITEALLKSPLVTKLSPPFWMSLTTLLITNAHNGRNQIAAKFCWAQVKEVVNASSTVTAQLVSLPFEQIFAAEQSAVTSFGSLSAAGQRVGLWPAATMGQ